MFTLLKRWYQRHFSQPGTIEFAAVLICAFLIVYYLMWLVGPLVVALCLAYCLDWPVEFLEKKFQLSRHFAASIVMLLFCSIAISITVLIVPQIVKQGVEFYSSIVSFSREASAEARQHSLPKGQVQDNFNIPLSLTLDSVDALTHAKIPEPVLSQAQTHWYQYQQLSCPTLPQENKAGSASSPLPQQQIGTGSDAQINPESGFALTVSDFDIHVAQQLGDILITMPEPLPSLITKGDLEKGVKAMRIQATAKIADVMRTQLMPSVVNAFTWLVYIIIVPIFTFLMLYNKKELQKRVRTYILPTNQNLIMHFWPSLNQQIAGYIRGKLIHILLITIANTAAFMVMGVNYAMLLGVGVGLSVVIPYVGAVIIAVPVVLVAIFQFGFSSTLLWVLIIYTFIQLLDSNVLTPMLFSKAMNLDAFSILSAIMIFGGLWGFWGVFFAIPMATFIKTLLIGWPGTGNSPNYEAYAGKPRRFTLRRTAKSAREARDWAKASMADNNQNETSATEETATAPESQTKKSSTK